MNQFTKNQRKLLAYLIFTGVLLMAICLIAALTLGVIALVRPDAPAEDPPLQEEPDTPPANEPDTPTGKPGNDTPASPRVLGPTADAGMSYIDDMIFVGESTTAHFRRSGALTGGTLTKQVWSNELNTMMLDLTILHKPIIYPETGTEMTIPTAVALHKPKYIVLSFGVNGLSGFGKNENLYKTAYGKLISAIHEASPDTVVLLQTVYPLSACADGAADKNAIIRRLNGLLPDIAQTYDAYVVDTASAITDANGYLPDSMHNGDGMHLKNEVYVELVKYLRTHAYIK